LDPNGQAAALYSQLTGVVAGFAFTAIVLLLERRKQPGAREARDATDEHSRTDTSTDRSDAAGAEAAMDGAFVFLLASFIGFALCSLTYAVIAGEPEGARGANEHVLAGVGFGTSTLMLQLALVGLFGIYAKHIESFSRDITVYCSPLLILFYVTVNVFQAAQASHWSSLAPLIAICAAAVLCPLVAALRPSRQRENRLNFSTSKRIAGVGIGLTILIAMGVPLINIASSSPDESPFWPVLLALAAASSAATVFIGLCKPARAP